MAFVFKDFKKTIQRITVVPRENIDQIQTFLNEYGILYFQGKMNLDWKSIMANVRSDLRGFISNGGWSFLAGKEDDHDEATIDDDVNEGERSDDYMPSEEDEDIYSEDDESEEYSDGGEGDEDDYASDSGDPDEDLSDEGLSWDEMERQAEA